MVETIEKTHTRPASLMLGFGPSNAFDLLGKGMTVNGQLPMLLRAILKGCTQGSEAGGQRRRGRHAKSTTLTGRARPAGRDLKIPTIGWIQCLRRPRCVSTTSRHGTRANGRLHSSLEPSAYEEEEFEPK